MEKGCDKAVGSSVYKGRKVGDTRYVARRFAWAFRRLERSRSREISPAATRFIAFAPNFPFYLPISDSTDEYVLKFLIVFYRSMRFVGPRLDQTTLHRSLRNGSSN